MPVSGSSTAVQDAFEIGHVSVSNASCRKVIADHSHCFVHPNTLSDHDSSRTIKTDEAPPIFITVSPPSLPFPHTRHLRGSLGLNNQESRTHISKHGAGGKGGEGGGEGSQ